MNGPSPVQQGSAAEAPRPETTHPAAASVDLTRSEAVAAAPSLRAQFAARRLPWGRADWIILLVVTLLGGALRFYQLGVTPPGFQFDEAYNAIDAVQVLQGNLPLFLPANGGREVLYTYFQAGLIALLGESVWSFRLASALWGTAGVAAAFLLFRTLLRRESRLIAACGALALAISYWHIHYSHFGIRVITMPVLFSALFGLYWSATQAASARRRVWLYVAAGVVMGLSVYSNPTGRLTPLVILAYTVALLWRNPEDRRFGWSRPLGGLILAGGAAAIVFLPLGITFLRHPEFFLGHAAEVSVFAERVSGEASALQTILTNALHVAGMFNFFGDREWTHGIAGRPVLDWALAVPFILGAGVWAARLVGRGRRNDEDGDALWLLFFWVVVMLAPSIFSDAAPNTSRTLPSLPASYLPLAFGLAWIVWLPQHPKDAPVRSLWPRPWMGYTLAGLLLLTSAVITVRDYFVRYPAMREVYIAYDVEKLDALNHLGARAESSTVYLSPLWANHATVRYLRSRYGIRSLDATQAIVLPPEGDALFAFTNEEQARAESVAAQWPGIEVEVVGDRDGHPMLFLVTVPAAFAAEWPPGTAPDPALEVRFDDAPTLLGMDPVEGGRINLFWRAEASTFRNLTSFVHLVDAEGNRIAQVDRLPGDGSFQTPFWQPGERVVDHTVPEYIDPCAGGEPAQALVGWYEWAADNARRPLLGAPGEMAQAGTVTLPVRPYLYAHERDSRGEDETVEVPQPEVALEGDLGGATLLGYTLRHADLQPGGALVVDLYLRAESEVASLPASLSLEAAGVSLELADATILPERPLQEGDEACRRLRTRLPEWSAGERTLTLTGPAGAIALQTLEIEEAVPAPAGHAAAEMATPVDARFAESLTLVGATVVAAANGELPVQLLWRAEAAAEWPVVAFVQLLGPDGRVVAQSDAPPGSRAVALWAPGEEVLDERVLALPAELPAGPFRLVAGLYDPLTLLRLGGVDGDGAPLPDNAVLLAQIESIE